MLWWMCGKIIWDRIKMTTRVVVHKVEKMVETGLRWYGCIIEREHMDIVAR